MAPEHGEHKAFYREAICYRCQTKSAVEKSMLTGLATAQKGKNMRQKNRKSKTNTTIYIFANEQRIWNMETGPSQLLRDGWGRKEGERRNG